MKTDIDVAVIGGGVAGLSAALQLGRARQKVRVFDSGLYRNRAVGASHGWLTRDGASPAELYRLGWQDLGQYPTVERVQTEVKSLVPEQGQWRILCSDQEPVTARRVVLATGVRDELLPIKGLQERLGKEVQLCPYCHAYEWRDRPLGMLMPDPAMIGHLGPLLRQWTDDLRIWLQGHEADPALKDKLLSLGARLHTERIVAVRPQNGGLQLQAESGETHWVQGLFTHPLRLHQSPLLEGLGCELTEQGFIKVDAFQATSLPGLFAAGDNCSPLHTLVMGSSSGALAGIMAHRSLVFEH